MYDTVEQVNMRLVNSIIMIGNQPAYVHDCTLDPDEGEIRIHYLTPSGLERSCLISDSSINSRTMRLGYVNHRNTTYYFTRMPARQQSQGLTRRNTCTYFPGSTDSTQNMYEELRRGGQLYSMLLNQYPTIDECAYKINSRSNDISSMAFHKHFALVRNDNFDFLELHFKNERIGYGELGNFTLPSRYNYLTEIIQQSGVSIR